MSPAPAVTEAVEPWAEPAAISNRPSLGALATVVRITIARQIRGKRIWLFVLLFLAPLALALLFRRRDVYSPDEVERILIFGLIPQAVLPLTSLLFASSLVQDDVEEQTLTYFLIRPIPRWTVYLAKVLGATIITTVLAAGFTAATFVAVRWGNDAVEPTALLKQAATAGALTAPATLAYISIFGFLGLLTRRVLVLGVGYILVFEGIVSNIPFLIRNATILFHLRVLAVRLMNQEGAPWSIDPAEAPTVATSLLALVGTAALFLALGAWLFSVREYRVKTPEGS